MKKVEKWRKKKVRESKVGVRVLTFTKKENDSITMERTKMTKSLYYYGTERIVYRYETHITFIFSFIIFIRSKRASFLLMGQLKKLKHHHLLF